MDFVNIPAPELVGTDALVPGLTKPALHRLHEVQVATADYSRWHAFVRSPCALRQDTSIPEMLPSQKIELAEALTLENQMLEVTIAQLRAQQLANQILAKNMKPSERSIVATPWEDLHSTSTGWGS
jgi:hypothetical protein